MYLFFDTETTGVPKNYKAPVSDLDNWPRVIQLAWALFNEDGKCFEKSCNLIYPDGWEIPNEKFWIDNGYNTERNKQLGIPMENALHSFVRKMDQAKFIIAHNMDFDNPVLGSEMIRYQILPQNKPQKFCTMKSSTSFCAIPNSRGGYKWPKLEELHLKLFGNGFEGAHDALNDVMACAKCFFDMKDKNIISLEPKPVQENPFTKFNL